VTPRMMATGGIFDAPVVGPLLERTGGIRVERGTELARSAVRVTEVALVHGGHVVAYPEGRIGLTADGWPERGRTGMARMALGIGVPGLGLYLGARELGWNTTVQASALADNWWTVPVLVLSALQNSLLEEVVMIGYLFVRLGELGWRWPVILLVSAGVRGSYHLYQGFGGFVGNVVMGLVFGRVWQRTGRLWPAGAHRRPGRRGRPPGTGRPGRGAVHHPGRLRDAGRHSRRRGALARRRPHGLHLELRAAGAAHRPGRTPSEALRRRLRALRWQLVHAGRNR